MSYSSIKNRETRQIVSLSAISKFKNFINGVGKSNELFRSTSKDLAESNISTSTETAKTVDFVNDKYIIKLLDTQNGGRFMRDIVGGSAFGIEESESDRNGLLKRLTDRRTQKQIDNASNEESVVEKSLKFHYEGDGKYTSAISMNELSQTFKKNSETLYSPQDGKKDSEGKVETKTAYGFDTNSPTESTVNKENSKPSKDNPTLGAITFKDSLLSINSRNSDALAIFFNGISPLEMSRCSPYISLQIIQGDRFDSSLSSLNNVSYMRFIRGDKGKNEFVLNDGIGISTAVPVDLSKFGDDDSAFKDKYFAGMEIFGSPQTMANANVRSMSEDLNDVTVSGKNILEPISPFLTLKDLKVSISGLGQGLFASKRADLSLTLHDRSRLKDIAPLVSTELFGRTQILIEYGWNHPDGDGSRNNPMGEFLNSLRDVSVFNVVNSNFSFGNDNSVSINVNLAAMGSAQLTTAPSAAGYYVPFDIIKPRIDSILEGLVKSKNGFVLDEGLAEVRPQIKAISSTSSRALVERSTVDRFNEAIKKLRESIDNKRSGFFILPDTPKTISDVIRNQKLQSDFTTELDDIFSSITQISQEIEDSSTTDRVRVALQSKLEHARYLTRQGKDYFREDTVYPDLFDVEVEFAANETGEEFISLGMIVTKFVGIPLSVSGQYDEVQLMFYPINQQAGAARIHTTASFPLEYSKLQELVIGVESNLTIQGFMNRLESSIIKDNGAAAYGLRGVVEDSEETYKKTQKEWLTEARAQLEAEVKEAGESEGPVEFSDAAVKTRATKLRQEAIDANKKAFTDQLEEVYKDVPGPPAQLSFTSPNITFFIETIPVISKDPAEEDKTICRVHVYDEETDMSPTDKVLQSLITEKEIKVFVDNSSAPGNNDTNSKEMVERINEAAEPQPIVSTENLMVLQKKLTNEQIKNRIKSVYPTLIHGSSTGTIKSLSVSSNTSGAAANVLLVQAISQKGTAGAVNTDLVQEQDVKLIPASLSVECMGCPVAQRGSQVYVDFGTNSTLDNVYTIVSVSHSVSAGNFSTTLTLAYTGQGNVEPFRKKIDALKDYITS